MSLPTTRQHSLIWGIRPRSRKRQMRQPTETTKPRHQTHRPRVKPPHLIPPAIPIPRPSLLLLPMPLPLALQVRRGLPPLRKSRQPISQRVPSQRHPKTPSLPLTPARRPPILRRLNTYPHRSLPRRQHRKPPRSDTTQAGLASSSPAKLPSSRPTTLSHLCHPYTKIQSSSKSTLTSHSFQFKDQVDDWAYTH
jgi:hypothetical protein